ncbi:MAG: methyltransferase domain-containing protein [candidate division Zixibacteria bacterium]|nr:class I SAM-dependent methyltransferase [Phycisphaerae bacterium]NIR66611.1 class I SAM-dependent methyltransferase [candidate division Zixibacteria bacterium]NIS48172.1 class I SAM-dependent methyltransferase [candidate division Zixibacteria bacterium]NIU16288.1 class I SAM-dependent methyltransferase [candidate division Zixibacteria bacterium]NIV08413.1 methyltransferase domain-containing protein [candidate division Zixibacteria bacterium]
MAFLLDSVIPWGRSFEEYVRMFDLTEDDLDLGIVSCGDGPASFNCQMYAQGRRVVSCDPIYRFSAEQLRIQIDASYDKVMTEIHKNKNNFVWETIKSPEELGRVRMEAIEKFLADYEKGRQEGRYLPESLPSLPFRDKEFDLVLCSHFLFLYTEQLSLDFHKKAVTEMCRVAREIRIFPLIDLDLNKSSYIPTICSILHQDGFTVEILEVPYEFQRGGNEMMRICSK